MAEDCAKGHKGLAGNQNPELWPDMVYSLPHSPLVTSGKVELFTGGLEFQNCTMLTGQSKSTHPPGR
jgi:hypothetical protein